MQTSETHKVINLNDKSKELTNIIYKVNLIERELNQMYFEREIVIKNMIATIVSKNNMFLIGLPGSGKSELINEFSSRIEGCKYFSWLFNKTTDPSEIFGSFSIKQMENDKFVRITKGKLPDANIIFADEIYKASEPVLNSLLSIANERVFYNDGLPVKTPTISIFGASNEEPDSESLSALHDRFIVKMKVDYIKDPNNKLRMLTAKPPKNKTTITLDDLYLLQEEINNITISNDTLSKLIVIVNNLSQSEITVSDRKLKQSVKMLKASALLKNKKEVTRSDFDILLYIFSDGVNNVDIVRNVLKEFEKNFDNEFPKIKDNFTNTKNNINKLMGRDKVEFVLNSKSIFKKIVKDSNDLFPLVENDIQKTMLNNFTKEVENFSKAIIQDILEM